MQNLLKVLELVSLNLTRTNPFHPIANISKISHPNHFSNFPKIKIIVDTQTLIYVLNSDSSNVNKLLMSTLVS